MVDTATREGLSIKAYALMQRLRTQVSAQQSLLSSHRSRSSLHCLGYIESVAVDSMAADETHLESRDGHCKTEEGQEENLNVELHFCWLGVDLLWKRRIENC